jgi:hypothetical protein
LTAESQALEAARFLLEARPLLNPFGQKIETAEKTGIYASLI